MKIIAMERAVEGGGTPSTALLREEAAAVWRLHIKGMIRQAWFTVDTHNAVLEMECDAISEAADALAQLPLVAANAIRFDVIGLSPYDGFTRLFAS